MPGVRDLLPNYARAIAFARHIREDLDKEYKKNDVAYYRAAKESPYYHSLYSTEMSLQTEEAYRDTPTRVLANGRGFLRHGRTPQRAITSPLHPVTSLPLSRLFCGCLF